MRRIVMISLLLLSFSIMAAAQQNVTYFPKGRLDPKSTVKDNYRIERYSKFLNAMQEPSLWEMSQAGTNEAYRFLLLRFSDEPACVRVEIDGSGNVTVCKKTTGGKGGAQPEDLKINETKNLSSSDIQSLLTEINNTKFWDLKSSDFPGDSASINKSKTSKWIFEGIKDGNYQVIEISTPQTGTADAIMALGKAFLATSTLDAGALY